MRLHLFVALMLALPLSARAQIHADAHASNLRYTVTDLTPGDGQAAGVKLFAPGASTLSVFLDNGSQTDLHQDSTLYSLDLSAQLLADVRGRSFYRDGGSLQASEAGASYAFLRSDLATAYVQTVTGGPIVVIEVAPHTRVDAALDVTLALGMTAPVADGSHLKGQLWASLLLWPGFATQYIDEAAALVGEQIGHPYLLDDSVAETLGVSYANDSDYAVMALIQYQIGGNASAWTDHPLPVPEPAEWAMLAAGLGLAAMKKRRPHASGDGVSLGCGRS